MIDKTMPFSLKDERENEMKEILTTVYGALKEKGYNPIISLSAIFCPKILPI